MSKPYHGRPRDLPRVIFQGDVYHPHIVRRVLEPGKPISFGNEYGGYFKVTFIERDEVGGDNMVAEFEHFNPPKGKVVMAELRDILVRFAPAMLIADDQDES